MKNINKTKIHHNGVICSIDGRKARVKIERTSACSTCEAEKGCRRHGGKTMIVEVTDMDVLHHKVGDVVCVEMSTDMGHRAVLLGFGLPLILFVALLLTLHFVGFDDEQAALYALGVLVLYYLIIYILRGMVDRHFRVNLVK